MILVADLYQERCNRGHVPRRLNCKPIRNEHEHVRRIMKAPPLSECFAQAECRIALFSHDAFRSIVAFFGNVRIIRKVEARRFSLRGNIHAYDACGLICARACDTVHVESNPGEGSLFCEWCRSLDAVLAGHGRVPHGVDLRAEVLFINKDTHQYRTVQMFPPSV